MAIERDAAIKAGTHASGDLTSADEIRNFTIQDDMQGNEWVEWAFDTFVAPHRPIVVNASRAVSHGFWQFSGTMLMTPDMLDYWKTAFFPNDEASVAVTVRVYDEAGAVRYFTCQLNYPRPEDMSAALPSGQWRYVTHRFNRGTEIAAP